jgi:ABC-2 type transport system permease protein
VIGLGLLGLLIAASFVLYRAANALSNMLEFPIALVTGLMIPLALLPGWVRPLSWALAPTWGVRAIRRAALGGDASFAIVMCFGLGLVYVAIAWVLLGVVERKARQDATLSLT